MVQREAWPRSETNFSGGEESSGSISSSLHQFGIRILTSRLVVVGVAIIQNPESGFCALVNVVKRYSS
jgi:hypothetical protein